MLGEKPLSFAKKLVVKCHCCDKEVTKCDRCKKIYLIDKDVHQFLDGEFHSCFNCWIEWDKVIDKVQSDNIIILGSKEHHKLIRDWFNHKITEVFVFR